MSEDIKNDLKINYWFLLAVGAIIFISAAVTIFFFLKTNTIANQKLAVAAEAKRPATLDLTLITDDTCQDCFNINLVASSIAKENVKIKSQKTVDRASDEGKQLIAKYSIKKLPTLLAQGELDKDANLAQFFTKTGNINEDTFVFRQVGGPFVDADTGKVKGRVTLTLIPDITCAECYDVTQHELVLQQFGINTVGKIADVKSAAGQALINKYGIKMVPAFVITGDTNEYPSLKTVWPEVGVIASDGAYVFTKGVPLMGTYKNLTTNKVILVESNQ